MLPMTLTVIDAEVRRLQHFRNHLENLMSDTDDAIAKLATVKTQLVDIQAKSAALLAAAGSVPAGTLDPALIAAINDVAAAAKVDDDLLNPTTGAADGSAGTGAAPAA